MTSHYRLLSALFAILTAGWWGTATIGAQGLTASEAFASAPQQIFPLLDLNTRLDMMDYFNSGSTTASTNNLQGKSRITTLNDDNMIIELTEATTCQLAILPAGKDTIIAVITTVATPVADSSLALYSDDWETDLTARAWKAPTLLEWLTTDGRSHRDEVEGIVPFMLVKYTYDPSQQVLTLTNNTSAFLGDDVYSIVGSYISPVLTYRWTGKAFSSK
ncbi:MAG: DUF3256 family protein [Bacteroidales bacterium]|nr:DUF3256 family protein [Bacteroidales bacterium]